MSRNNGRRGAEFRTIAEALDAAAGGDAALRFFSSRGELASTMGYAALREAALTAGRALLSSGLAPGDRVALIAETGPDFLSAFYGCQYAGLVPCPCPSWPSSADGMPIARVSAASCGPRMRGRSARRPRSKASLAKLRTASAPGS